MNSTNTVNTASAASRSKVPLALCITELERGGAELALCNLAVRIDRNLFDPIVYSLKSRPENSAASCVPMLEDAGIPVRFLDISGAAGFAFGICKLRNFLKDQKPLVMQSFLFHANFLGRFAAKFAGVPHFFSGIRVAEQAAKAHLFFDQLTERLVEKHVCVSESVAKFSAEVGKLSPGKIVVIPNGIDASTAVRNYCEQPPDVNNSAETNLYETLQTVSQKRKKVICVGRIHSQKGIDWLLETCKNWLPKHENWELQIAGRKGDKPEDKEFSNRCEQLRLELGSLAERIHFLGWRADIQQLIAESELLVLPSRWEGMPNVLLQAAIEGLPVIATNVEGVREILGPELAEEQVVNFGDTERFCDKVEKIMSDEIFANKLGQNNRERVIANFDIKTTVQAYQNLWLEACQRCATPSREPHGRKSVHG